MTNPELELMDWRRCVSSLYAAIRIEKNPEAGHAWWRLGRDDLFRNHSQSPLPAGDPLRETGLPYGPYDPELRFELDLRLTKPARLSPATDGNRMTRMRRIGAVEVPDPVNATLDVWWVDQYGGGLFLPVRDGSAGYTSYGGGRYLLDTVKGSDLGRGGRELVVDLNFLYHPSCRYNSAWQSPLPPAGNTFSATILAGERL